MVGTLFACRGAVEGQSSHTDMAFKTHRAMASDPRPNPKSKCECRLSPGGTGLLTCDPCDVSLQYCRDKSLR